MWCQRRTAESNRNRNSVLSRQLQRSVNSPVVTPGETSVILDGGSCSDIYQTTTPGPASCPTNYEPVCLKHSDADGNAIEMNTYSNRCLAKL
jgi:hypothetical protein